MDRSLRTGYNLRSLNETRPEPSPQWPCASPSTSTSTSFSPSTGASSTATSSGFASRELSSLALAQHSHPHFPGPAPASASASCTQSGSGLTPDTRMCALLPSPSANETRSSWLQPQPQPQPQNPVSTNPALADHNCRPAATSRIVATTATATAGNYPHEINGNGGPMTTAPFLRDLNLVAEAAKRAQMSVVMRDLEGITL